MFSWLKSIGLIPRKSDCVIRSERDAFTHKDGEVMVLNARDLEDFLSRDNVQQAAEVDHDAVGCAKDRIVVATVSGRLFDVVSVDPFQVEIDEIAHALSQINRFCGHTKFPYSVAQHSVICSVECEDRFPSRPDLALACLLHDAAEAYCCDIIRPIKRLIAEAYRPIENRIQRAIWQRLDLLDFALDADTQEVIHQVDAAVVMAESSVLMKGSDQWDWDGVTPSFHPIQRWSPEDAKRVFIARFYKLSAIVEFNRSKEKIIDFRKAAAVLAR